MNKVLFIGNFLQKHRGTRGAIEMFFGDNDIHGIDAKLSSRKKLKLFRLIDMVLNTIFSDYSIIHIDTYSGQAFYFSSLCSFIARKRGKKVILNLHGGALPQYYEEKKQRVKQTFNRANLILTPSKYIQEYFNSKQYNIEYLPNALNLSMFPFLANRPETNSILWVRAFSKIYSPEIAIEVLKIVREDFSNATLTMIGPDRGCMNQVIEKIKNYDLVDEVKILGQIKNNELPDYYFSHDVYINTTEFESFGLSVMEAAATGIPIVSNSVGEISYLWEHAENAFLVDSNDPKLFAKYITQVFKSRDLARSVAFNARKKAELFDWEIVKKQWIDILE